MVLIRVFVFSFLVVSSISSFAKKYQPNLPIGAVSSRMFAGNYVPSNSRMPANAQDDDFEFYRLTLQNQQKRSSALKQELHSVKKDMTSLQQNLTQLEQAKKNLLNGQADAFYLSNDKKREYAQLNRPSRSIKVLLGNKQQHLTNLYK